MKDKKSSYQHFYI